VGVIIVDGSMRIYYCTEIIEGVNLDGTKVRVNKRVERLATVKSSNLLLAWSGTGISVISDHFVL
jgi:hypothetical protein